MNKLSLLSLLLLGAGLLTACDDIFGPGSVGCTEIGCSDQVNVDLGPIGSKYAGSLPLSISICIDAKGCEAFVVEASGGALQCRPDGGETLGFCSLDDKGNVTVSPGVGVGGTLTAGPHDVEMTVKGKDGMVLVTGSEKVTLKETRPNGPDCEPVCLQGSVTFPP